MKASFRNFDLDSRVAIVKQFAFDYQIQYWEAQDLLIKLNPVIRLGSNGFASFNNVNDQNEFYFTAQSYTL